MTDGVRNMQDVWDELDLIARWIRRLQGAIGPAAEEENETPGFVKPPRMGRCGQCIEIIQSDITKMDIAGAIVQLEAWVGMLREGTQSLSSPGA